VEVDRAFEASIDDVGEKGRGEKAEEPFAAGEKVVFVAGVILKVGREE
jgi:hypothetical protein